jgi:hypothetical protein
VCVGRGDDGRKAIDRLLKKHRHVTDFIATMFRESVFVDAVWFANIKHL